MNIQNGFMKYERYLKKKKRSKGTIEGYMHDLKMFIDFCGVTDLEMIDTDMLNNFLEHEMFDNENSTRTIHRKLQSIHSFFKYMYINGYITNRIKFDVIFSEMPAMEDKKLPVFLNEIQIEQFLKIVEDYHKEYLIKYKYAKEETINTREFLMYRDIAIYTMFCFTGLRISELLSIKTGDIQGTSLKVLGKGNKERIIYLNDRILKTLTDYYKILPNKNKFLFTTYEGLPLTQRVIQMFIKNKISPRLENLYNVNLTSNLTPHKLRHTFATLLLNRTGDITLVQSALGHESISTTRIYAKTTNKTLENAMRSI